MGNKTYKLDGKEYTEDVLNEYAKKSNLSLDEYIYESGAELVKKKESTSVSPTPSNEPAQNLSEPSTNDANDIKLSELSQKKKDLESRLYGNTTGLERFGREIGVGVFNLIENTKEALGFDVSDTKPFTKDINNLKEISSKEEELKNAIKDTREFIPKAENKTGKSLVDMTPQEFADVKRKEIDPNWKRETSIVNAANRKQIDEDFSLYAKALGNKIATNENQLKADGIYDKINEIKESLSILNDQKMKAASNPSAYNMIVGVYNSKLEQLQNIYSDPRIQEITQLQKRANILKGEFVKELKTQNVSDDLKTNQQADDARFEKYGNLLTPFNSLGKAANKMLVGALKLPKSLGDAVTTKEIPLIGEVDDFLFNLGTEQEMKGQAKYNAPTKLQRNISQKYVDYNGVKLLLDDNDKPYAVRSSDFGALPSLDGGKSIIDAYEKDKNKPEAKRDFSGRTLFAQATDVLSDIGMMASTGRLATKGLGGLTRMKEATRANLAGAGAIYTQTYQDFYNQVAQNENLTEAAKNRYAFLQGAALAMVNQYVGGFEKSLSRPGFRTALYEEMGKFQNQIVSGEMSAAQVAMQAAKKLGLNVVKNQAEEQFEENISEPLTQMIVDKGFNKLTGSNQYNIPSAEEARNTIIATAIPVLTTSIINNPYTRNQMFSSVVNDIIERTEGEMYDDVSKYYDNLRGLTRTPQSDVFIKAVKLAEQQGKAGDVNYIQSLIASDLFNKAAEQTDNPAVKDKYKKQSKEFSEIVSNELDGNPVQYVKDKHKEESEQAPAETQKADKEQMPEETPQEEPLNEPINVDDVVSEVISSNEILSKKGDDAELKNSLKELVGKVMKGEDLTDAEVKAVKKFGIKDVIESKKQTDGQVTKKGKDSVINGEVGFGNDGSERTADMVDSAGSTQEVGVREEQGKSVEESTVPKKEIVAEEPTKEENQTSESGQLEEQKPNKEEKTAVTNEETKQATNGDIVQGAESLNQDNQTDIADKSDGQQKRSEIDGERLSTFKKDDVVFRNYKGRYEEYLIVNTKKDVWDLESTQTGVRSTWNAENNGGFILKDSNIAITPKTEQDGQGNEKAETKRLLENQGKENSPLSPNSENNKNVWQETPESYYGVEKPNTGFNTDISAVQIANLSERAKSDLLKKRLSDKNMIRDNYNEAEIKWSQELIKSYEQKKFSLKDIVSNYENDALSIILELIGNKTGDNVSPFKLRTDYDRGGNLINELEQKYLKEISQEENAKTQENEKSKKRARKSRNIANVIEDQAKDAESNRDVSEAEAVIESVESAENAILDNKQVDDSFEKKYGVPELDILKEMKDLGKNANFEDAFKNLTKQDYTLEAEIDFLSAVSAEGLKIRPKLYPEFEEGKNVVKVYPINKKPITKKGVESADLLTTDDEGRAFRGVLFEEGNIVSTDAHRLVVLKQTESNAEIIDKVAEAYYKANKKVDKSLTLDEAKNTIKEQLKDGIDNKIISFKDGGTINQKYPDYKQVIPTEFLSSHSLPIQELINIVNGAYAVQGNLSNNVFVLRFDDNGIGYNPSLILELLQVLQSNGAKQIKISLPTKRSQGAIIEADNGNYGLMMPMFNKYDYGQSQIINLSKPSFSTGEETTTPEQKKETQKIIDFFNKAFGFKGFAPLSEFQSKLKELGYDSLKAMVDNNTKFIGRNGKEIGYTSDTEQTARERFDFSNLKKIGQGSDRTVFELGNGYVLKVAHTPRGLEQNIYEGDYYLDNILPNVIERGLNYVVAEETPRIKNADIVPIYNENREQIGETTAGEMFSDLKKFNQLDFEKHNSDLQDILTKYGFDDILSYDVLYLDFVAPRNWGYKEGKPYHLDGGTFGGIRMITSHKGKAPLTDPEFRDIYYKSKQFKKEFGDTDRFTKFLKTPQGKVLGFVSEGKISNEKLLSLLVSNKIINKEC